MAKVIQDKESQLLHRHELIVEVAYEKCPPSNKEAAGMIASQKKVDEARVAVKKIAPVYGEKSARIFANVYDSVDAKIKVEPKVKVKKAEAEGEAK